ncbi:MAG: hypothetical protein ACI80K_004770 [Paracoccaceae bacterium]|jgi:hypothetical protein
MVLGVERTSNGQHTAFESSDGGVPWSAGAAMPAATSATRSL